MFQSNSQFFYSFLQVLSWVQQALAAGESFSGETHANLRSQLASQSANFFRSFHASTLDGLHEMLTKEMWKHLALTPEGWRSLSHPNLQVHMAVTLVTSAQLLPKYVLHQSNESRLSITELP